MGRKNLSEKVWPLKSWICEWWSTYMCFFSRETLMYQCACRTAGCHWQTCTLMFWPMWCLHRAGELCLLGVCCVFFLLEMSTEFLWTGLDLTDIYRSIFHFLAHLRWLCVQVKLWDLVMKQMWDLGRNNLNLRSWWAKLGSSTSQVTWG